MDFALCPDNGPPRLIRFGRIDGKTLSVIDAENNVLRIDLDFFGRLSHAEQEFVIRTRLPLISVERDELAAE